MNLDPIRPYLTLIYVVMIGLVVLGVLMLVADNRRLREKIRSKDSALAQFRAAQETNLATITDLGERLNRLVTIRAIERRQAEDAAERAALAAQDLNRQLAATTRELNDLYAKSETARQWGASGVDADVAARLPGGRRSH
jgi:multidrug resistance efflux pump